MPGVRPLVGARRRDQAPVVVEHPGHRRRQVRLGGQDGQVVVDRDQPAVEHPVHGARQGEPGRRLRNRV